MSQQSFYRRLAWAGAVALTFAALSVTGATASGGHGSAEDRGAPPVTKVIPSDLGKGTTPGPYVRNKTLFDGDKKIKLKIEVSGVDRLGKGYLATTIAGPDGWGNTLYRIAPGGKMTKLRTFKKHVWTVEVSTGGRKVAVEEFWTDKLYVVDAYTGKVERTKKLAKKADVLAYIGKRILLSKGMKPSKLSWYSPGTNKSKAIGSVPGWAMGAAPKLDVLVTNVGEGGGCRAVHRFDRPRTKLWRTCEIFAGFSFSPNGKYVLTSDDPHDRPKDVRKLRRVSDGAVIRTFEAPAFGNIGWEDGNTFLIQASADATAGMARCNLGGSCTRVTDLVTGRDDLYALEGLGVEFFDQAGGIY